MNVQCKEDIERLTHSLNEQFLKNAKKYISWCDWGRAENPFLQPHEILYIVDMRMIQHSWTPYGQ